VSLCSRDMESTSFSPGHDYVCQRLTPEHRIDYFVLGNSGKLRYRNPKASPAMTAGFEPIAALGWWIQASGPASRVRPRTTRSSFTSFGNRYGSQEENCIALQREVLRCTWENAPIIVKKSLR
jgi:hypothetical protein